MARYYGVAAPYHRLPQPVFHRRPNPANLSSQQRHRVALARVDGLLFARSKVSKAMYTSLQGRGVSWIIFRARQCESPRQGGAKRFLGLAGSRLKFPHGTFLYSGAVRRREKTLLPSRANLFPPKQRKKTQSSWLKEKLVPDCSPPLPICSQLSSSSSWEGRGVSPHFFLV